MITTWRQLITFLEGPKNLAVGRLGAITGPWPESEAELQRTWEAASKVNLAPFLIRHLWARWLLTEKDEKPDWLTGYLFKHPDTASILEHLDLDNLSDWKWSAIPVLAVSPGCGGFDPRAGITYFIVGRGHGASKDMLPSWAKPCLDDGARRGIRHACSAARNRTAPGTGGFYYYIWPLIQPPLTRHQGPAIGDGSLGLPLAVGLALLNSGKKWPDRLMITGRLDESGQVEPVNGLGKKLEMALESKANMFIYPSKGEELTPSSDIQIKTVSRWEQALHLSLLFEAAREDPQLLSFYLQCGLDFNYFLNNFEALPVFFLDLHEAHTFRANIDAHWKKQEILKKLAEKIYEFRSDPKGKYLMDFISIETVAEISDLSEEHKVRIYELAYQAFNFFNYQGDPEQSNQWDDLAHRLLPEDPSSRLRYLNRSGVIGKRHNVYDFRPDLPREFKEAYRRSQEKYDLFPGTDRDLGAACGTIAQNYAFCGPKYLPEVKEYVEKGLKAFGSTLLSEARRLYSYLAFACLDAHDVEQARTALLQYLDQTSIHEAIENLLQWKRYQHFALARFLADAGTTDEKSDFWERVETPGPDPIGIGFEYPWQVWAWNVGRIVWDLDLAERAVHYWQTSAKISLNTKDSKETVRVMALLPLSSLYTRVHPRPAVIDKTGILLDEIGHSRHFNLEHFHPLLDASDPGSALELVANHPERFFPFMYR